jgi:hypothetical protein
VAGDLAFIFRADGAVARVLARRVQQLKDGFTLDADEGKSMRQLLELVRGHALDAQSDWPLSRQRRDPNQLRQDLERCATMCIAALDRLDRAAEQRNPIAA